MAKKHKSQAQKDIEVAKARNKVRFAPEQSTITAAVNDAGKTYLSDVTSADAAKKSAIHFANKARKPVQKIFDTALSNADAAHSDVQAAFGRLGGASEPFQVATSREEAGRHERLAQAGADALYDLQQRKLEAKAGAQYAKESAKQDLHSTLSDLRGRLIDLNQREGANLTVEADARANARAGRQVTRRNSRDSARQSERNSIRSSGIDPDTGKPIPGGKLDKTKNTKPGLGGAKPAKQKDLISFQSTFARALADAQNQQPEGVLKKGKKQGYKYAPLSRDEMRSILTRGKTIQKGGSANDVVKAVEDPLAIELALDQIYHQRATPGHVKQLHKRGIRASQISGLTSSAAYNKRRRSQQLGSGAG